MHSGNVGHAQSLETLVVAATFLRDLDDVEIVIAGFGARHASILTLAARVEAGVRFLRYQPRGALLPSLSTGAVHFGGFRRGGSATVRRGLELLPKDSGQTLLLDGLHFVCADATATPNWSAPRFSVQVL